MTDRPEQAPAAWEAQIDAWLEDELEATEFAALETEAGSKPELAQALAEARQLKNLLTAAPRLTAPTILTRRLLAVANPGTGWRQWTQLPWLRRGAALACLSLVLLVTNRGGPDQPSEAEILQGQRDLAVALTYLGQATQRTSLEIDRSLNHNLYQPVARTTLQTLNQQPVLVQEYAL